MLGFNLFVNFCSYSLLTTCTAREYKLQVDVTSYQIQLDLKLYNMDYALGKFAICSGAVPFLRSVCFN